MKLPIGTYTFYNDFQNCPHKAFRRHVARDLSRGDPTPEMAWGIAVHEAIEDRFKKDTPLPETMLAAEPLIHTIDNIPGVVPRIEYRLGMRADGSACAYDAQAAWFRGKLDVAVLSTNGTWLIDWKTGKVREEPFELECQAMLVHANHSVDGPIIGEYFWLKEGRAGLRYTLDPMKAFMQVGKLYGLMVNYFENQKWPKQKNPLCSYCDVRDCENNRSEKRK